MFDHTGNLTIVGQNKAGGGGRSPTPGKVFSWGTLAMA